MAGCAVRSATAGVGVGVMVEVGCLVAGVMVEVVAGDCVVVVVAMVVVVAVDCVVVMVVATPPTSRNRSRESVGVVVQVRISPVDVAPVDPAGEQNSPALTVWPLAGAVASRRATPTPLRASAIRRAVSMGCLPFGWVNYMDEIV